MDLLSRNTRGDMRRRKTARGPARSRRRAGTHGARKASIEGESTADLRTQLELRTRERDDAIKREKASAQVLRVISSSPNGLKSVFDVILANAVRLCEASYGAMWLREGNSFRNGAFYGELPKAYTGQWQSGMVTQAGVDTPMDRIAISRRPVHVADLRTDRSYRKGHPLLVAAVDVGGIRTYLGVPMLKANELVGVIAIYRREVRRFTDKQIDLLNNFAAQAVIAIENTRLLHELTQRTSDLTESLDQQTATSDVLRVISSSPADLRPVFETILDNAVRICKTHFGVLLLFETGRMRVVAMKNAPPGFAEMRRRDPYIPLEQSVLGPLVRTKRLAHVADITVEEPYAGSPLAKVGGARTALGVPMLRDDELVGAIAFYRQEVEPFSDKQIALLQSFAAQAVIAIENARLLNELRQRTNELTESLDQQTATSEVLRVISSSTGELDPVFAAMLQNAVRICGAQFGNLLLRDADTFRVGATHGAPPAYVDFMRREAPFRVDPRLGLGRMLESKATYQVADIAAVATHGDKLRVATIELAGARTVLGVPMLKDDEMVGCVIIYRQEVRPFTDKQIELLQNFAAQAVIAIENARLLNELRLRTDDLSQSLENLRATQDRLVQTQKLASLGQLTAGIAHEIKNPLNFVNNFSGVSAELIDELQEALKAGSFDDKTRDEVAELTDTLRGNLEKIVQHGKRADSIVKNMLLHSREGSGEHRLVDINALVEESLNLAYHGGRAEKHSFNVTLERTFDPAAGQADLYPQDITRVLLNLISNGFYAALKRKAETADGDHEPVLAAATRDLGHQVEISIRDNGTGIPPEVKDKMFNPFFTTKPAGEGTGLGLSISHDIIVKQHAGTIEVATQPGEFTEIRIVLPRSPAFLGQSGGSSG